MRPASIEMQFSAGGVIYRLRGDDEADVALISVKNGTVWALPKGIIDKGESAEQTALREVVEETGLRGAIVEDLGETSYWFNIRERNVKCKKTVHYYLLRYESGDTSAHDREVDDAAWVPIGEAIGRATYKGDREIIRRARKALKHVRQSA